MRELTGRGRMGGRILLFLFLAFSLAFFPTADSSGGDSVIQWVRRNGPCGGVINTLVVHPSNPDIAYAGTFRWGTWPNTLGNGVFKTTDGGRTWHRANGADGILYGKPINSITLDPGDPEILYVLAFPTGIFKSSDGGGSWQKIFAKQNTIGFGLSESDTNILYASALQGFNGPLIVYRSGDSGMTWRRAGSVPGTYDGCLHCLKNIVAVDPHNPDVVFVGTSEGIYKSRNGGQSWEAKSEGLTRRDMKSIVINPSNSQIVYALTGQEDLEGCFEGDK
ncbi:MAG: hypothetical protein ACE5LQ_04195, partial [Candidatus Bipolaricaulia bacterium]